MAWLTSLPDTLSSIARRWSLLLDLLMLRGELLGVAPVIRADRTSAGLKLGMLHMEEEHEAQGLRFWNGLPHGTVAGF